MWIHLCNVPCDKTGGLHKALFLCTQDNGRPEKKQAPLSSGLNPLPFFQAASFYFKEQLTEKLCLFRFGRHILRTDEASLALQEKQQDLLSMVKSEILNEN